MESVVVALVEVAALPLAAAVRSAWQPAAEWLELMAPVRVVPEVWEVQVVVVGVVQLDQAVELVVLVQELDPAELEELAPKLQVQELEVLVLLLQARELVNSRAVGLLDLEFVAEKLVLAERHLVAEQEALRVLVPPGPREPEYSEQQVRLVCARGSRGV